ncbi:MAG: hypothetical protein ACXWE9_03460 [Methylobacter sp.]
MRFENRWKSWCRAAFPVVAFIFPVLNAFAVNISAEQVPFQAFYSGVANVRYQDYAKKEGVKVADATEFEKMKAHVLSFYEDVRVKNSFVMDSDYIDCVDVNTQPSLRQNGKFIALAQPPEPMIAKENAGDQANQGQPVEPMLSKEKKDAFGNLQYCEQGLIPIRRITLDRLVSYKTLADFFNKYGHAGEKGLPIRK